MRSTSIFLSDKHQLCNNEFDDFLLYGNDPMSLKVFFGLTTVFVIIGVVRETIQLLMAGMERLCGTRARFALERSTTFFLRLSLRVGRPGELAGVGPPGRDGGLHALPLLRPHELRPPRRHLGLCCLDRGDLASRIDSLHWYTHTSVYAVLHSTVPILLLLFSSI